MPLNLVQLQPGEFSVGSSDSKAVKAPHPCPAAARSVLSPVRWLKSCQCPHPCPAAARTVLSLVFDVMNRPDMWFLTCVPNFSSLACLEVPQEPPRPRSHTWRMLKVPDWSLGGQGHHWCHGSSSYVVRNLCTKFQVNIFIFHGVIAIQR